jgi:hypothetical protein
MHIVESLASRDITKFDMVLDRAVKEVFTHLSYMRDYAQEERRLMNQAMRKHV